jgi:isopenicillin-N epimerase
MTSPQPPAPLRPALRAEWLLDERITFLNHGSFGAVPRAVFDEQSRWRQRIEAEPIEVLGRRMHELLTEAKRPLGAWLNMRGEDFGFVTNATEGVNAVLRGLDLRPGDELLTTTHVYNAVRQAMRNVAGRSGAAYREVDVPVPLASADEVVEKVTSALGARTRLLVIDHVTSPTAVILPVERIAAACAARGVDVLVDGAHAPGMLAGLDVPATGAAYYAANLHKWCCAPKGSAFLWVRPDRQAQVHPLVVSHHFGKGLEREFAWQGTRDFSSWLSVPAALGFMGALGWEAVMAHNHAMAVWAQHVLCERWGVRPLSPGSGELIGSMASVPLPGELGRLDEASAQGVQRRLYDEFRIEAPIMLWQDRAFVRPCCQVYNVPGEVQRLAEAVDQIRQGGR